MALVWRQFKTTTYSYSLREESLGRSYARAFLHTKPAKGGPAYWTRFLYRVRVKNPIPEGMTVDEMKAYALAQYTLLKGE
jgi:hypothetical protein